MTLVPATSYYITTLEKVFGGKSFWLTLSVGFKLLLNQWLVNDNLEKMLMYMQNDFSYDGLAELSNC